jgi:ABC-type arginine transport system permease subunit
MPRCLVKIQRLASLVFGYVFFEESRHLQEKQNIFFLYYKKKILLKKITLLCISIETVEVGFFVTGVETLQILGVELSTGGSTKSNLRSFQAFFTIYLSIITTNT